MIIKQIRNKIWNSPPLIKIRECDEIYRNKNIYI